MKSFSKKKHRIARTLNPDELKMDEIDEKSKKH